MRTVFRCVNAYVGRIESQTRALIWDSHPVKHNFAEGLLFPIDLSRTPSAAVAKRIRWSEVEIDDFERASSPGLTSIGPQFPHAYPSGGVYLEEEYYRRACAAARFGAATVGHDYEFEAVVYWDIVPERAGIRYHGFHGHVLYRVKDGGKAFVAIHNAGASGRKAPAKKVWIDLGDPKQCDRFLDTEVGELQRGRTKIAAPRDAGAIFVEYIYARDEIGLEIPKKPAGTGKRLGSALMQAEGVADTLDEEDDPPRSDSLDGMVLSIVDATDAAGDDEVGEIAYKLRFKDTVDFGTDGMGLYDVLAGLAARITPAQQRSRMLDLIGHSRREDHVLMLGEWPVDLTAAGGEFARLAAPPDGGGPSVLERLGVTHIRLLGCRTACCSAAREVALEIARVINPLPPLQPVRKVMVSKADLAAPEFDPWTGFSASDLLIEASAQDPGDCPPRSGKPCGAPAGSTSGGGETSRSSAPDFTRADLSAVDAARVSARDFRYLEVNHFNALLPFVETKDPVLTTGLARPALEIFVAKDGTPTEEKPLNLGSFDVMDNPQGEYTAVQINHSDGKTYRYTLKDGGSAKLVALLALR